MWKRQSGSYFVDSIEGRCRRSSFWLSLIVSTLVVVFWGRWRHSTSEVVFKKKPLLWGTKHTGKLPIIGVQHLPQSQKLQMDLSKARDWASSCKLWRKRDDQLRVLVSLRIAHLFKRGCLERPCQSGIGRSHSHCGAYAYRAACKPWRNLGLLYRVGGKYRRNMWLGVLYRASNFWREYCAKATCRNEAKYFLWLVRYFWS